MSILKSLISYLLPTNDGEREQFRGRVRDVVHGERNFSAVVIAEQKQTQKALDEATRTARNVIARLERTRRHEEQERRKDGRGDAKSI